MGDDITIGVTEIVNTIEVTAQPNDQIVDISVIDNSGDVTLNITPTVIEINLNKGSSFAQWGNIFGDIEDQTDLQNVLDLKADLVGGKVPSSQLPSYVDDVVEVANYAALPSTGESGKIYITIDNNKIYRWTGSTYVEITDSTSVWGGITGTLSSQTDLQSALDGKFDNPTGDTTQYIAGDGSLITFPTAGEAATLVRQVRNTTGATLTKGTIVYINGAVGNKPTVAKAIATGDSTSAQTFGMVQADISNNANGYVVCVGDLIGLNTLSIAEGAQLYLSSTTAGAYTTTKQLAPAHLVYIGVVTRSHATLGQIEVKIQNGYELDELHDVAISTKSDKDILTYESSTNLWKNKNLGTIIGGSGSQFLKGNGVLDSTPYATDFSVVHLTGDETITGKKTFNNSGSSISIDINNSSTGKGLNSLNSSSGFGIYSNNSSTGNGIHSVNSSTGKGIYSSNTSSAVGIYSDNSSTGAGLFSVNSSTGNGIHATNSSTGKGIYALNTSTGFAMYAENQSTGKGIYSLNSSTGYGIHSENASTGRGIYSDNKLGGYGIYSLNSSTGTGIYSDNTSTGKGIHFVNSANGTGLYAENTSAGNGIYLNNTNSGSGILIDNTGANGLRINNSSSTNGIRTINSSTGNGIYLSNQSSGKGIYSYNSSTGYGIHSVNDSAGSGIYAENSSSTGKGIYLSNTGIVGFEVLHNSGGTGILLENSGFKGLVVNNNSSGRAVIINNITSATGTPFAIQKNSVDKFTISDAGGVFAAGSVGIGTSSPTEKLSVSGGNISLGAGYKLQYSSTAYITPENNVSGAEIATGGILTIKTGGTTERVRVDASGNLGIGTTSPPLKNSIQASTSGGNNSVTPLISLQDDRSDRYSSINIVRGAGSYDIGMSFSTVYETGGSASITERFRINPNGNVGIGTTSLVSYTGYTVLTLNNSTNGGVLAVRNGASTGLNLYATAAGGHISAIDATKALIFETADIERMRITSGGSVLLGTTDTGFNARQLIRFDASGASTNGLAIWNGGGSGASFTVFANSGGAFIGSITQVGTTGVAYNTTSDYRLKQDFKPFNGLDLVSKIKVYDYAWKVDNSRMNGVIAHELQEVVPYAVTGEKDAEQMQSVDYSKLVPILVQAIQDQQKQINELKTLINK